MTSKSSDIPQNLRDIMEDFQICEGTEKIELLIQYSELLPELPIRFRENRDSMEPVEECMTPVFVIAEEIEGKLYFFFDVPIESPTVRGFAAMLQAGLNGTTAEGILKVPNDFFHTMGLDQVLTMQRLNGLSAILAHMKRSASQMINNGQNRHESSYH